MKIVSVELERFKRFKAPYRLDLLDPALAAPADRFLILGDNGTGKTTLLQAIALTLALASGRIRDVSEFAWKGWLPGRFLRWGTPRVELHVALSAEEITATREIAQRWWDALPAADREGRFVEPGDSAQIRIVLDGGAVHADTPAELSQLRGRTYAARLVGRGDRLARAAFKDLPGVFWFDQFRTIASARAREDAEEGAGGQLTFEGGAARLRGLLNAWHLGRLSRSYPVDYLKEIEDHYKLLFPGRRFGPPEPRYETAASPDDFYFTLDDGSRTYDLEEMSAGEQAIFPILFEFVRQQIARSVVLVDELDLNLHPPLAQALLRQLPRLGEGNQIVFTTHSEAVSALMNPSQTHRIVGGQLCL